MASAEVPAPHDIGIPSPGTNRLGAQHGRPCIAFRLTRCSCRPLRAPSCRVHAQARPFPRSPRGINQKVEKGRPLTLRPFLRSTILRAVLIPTFATFFATLAIGYYATHIAPVYHYPPLVKIGYPFLGARRTALLPSHHLPHAFWRIGGIATGLAGIRRCALPLPLSLRQRDSWLQSMP